MPIGFLIQLIVVLIVLGLLLYLVSLLPLDAVIKQIIHVLIILVAILWLLSVLGLIPAHAKLAMASRWLT